MRTLVVNLYGGPGAGKTTLAHWLVAELSKMGVLTEYVPEVAKALVWQGGRCLLDGSRENQRFVTEAQIGLIDNLVGQVEVVVTDSPPALGLVYADKTDIYGYDDLKHLVFSQRGRQDCFDVFVNRSSCYDERGRKHSAEESLDLDRKIRQLLGSMSSVDVFEYSRTDADIEGNFYDLLQTIFVRTWALSDCELIQP
ncbi:MAG: ATP-binding protein [Eggerthellaceae bacterium]|nr:ATP-binding protein [Eggerthellaceae bacterium]